MPLQVRHVIRNLTRDSPAPPDMLITCGDLEITVGTS